MSEYHTYKLSAINWLCFHYCPFEDHCRPSSIRCPILRFNKIKWAEGHAEKNGIALLDVPSVRALAESAGVEV